MAADTKVKPKRRKVAAKRRAPAPPRKSYHHGNLGQALIEATLQLIEEGGPARVTVSAAAKRAAVSSGAPFRHFPNRTALMTAVAEEATRRLRAEVERSLMETESDDTRIRFRAIGSAYICWALRNPTHFLVVSDRNLIDYEGSESLRRDNERIRALMEEVMTRALCRAHLPADEFAHLQLGMRALVYGLARMFADGHFQQWKVAGHNPESSMQVVLNLFIDALLRSAAAPAIPAVQ